MKKAGEPAFFDNGYRCDQPPGLGFVSGTGVCAMLGVLPAVFVECPHGQSPPAWDGAAKPRARTETAKVVARTKVNFRMIEVSGEPKDKPLSRRLERI